MRKDHVEGTKCAVRQLAGGWAVLAMAGMFLAACGGGGGSPEGTGGAGGKSAGTGGTTTGTGGAATGGAGGASKGTGGTSTGGSGGAPTGAGGTATGTGGTATGAGGTATGGASAGGSGGAPTGAGGEAGGTTGGSTGAAGGAAGSGAAGATGMAGAGATDAGVAGSGAVDAGTDAPPPAPATTIPSGPVDFGLIDCGAAGGSQPLAFTNSGNAVLHYRAAITPGGLFALMGAAADGSVSGDLAPGDTATLYVEAGVVPTTSAYGAVLTGAMAVMTNAAGADNAQLGLKMTASGSSCTLSCGSLTTCAPSNASPYCANTMTDNANCGTCGQTCGNGEVCTNGACTLACGALTTCTPSSGSPYCANTMTDNANCGTCAHACASGQVCGNGACTLTCGSLSTCTPSSGSPYCANLSTDDANCGTCAHACGSGQSCMGGVCQATCSSNETVCGGVCTNTAFDPANCSTCGNVCTFTQGMAACGGGTCVLAGCNAGYADCNHLQADGCESNSGSDPANCGGCGHACALGESCQTGVCTANLSAGLIGYWAMDDAAGSLSAADSGPNHLPAQTQGNVTFVPGAGKQGSGAISLGGNGYLIVQFPNDELGDGSGIFIPQGNITFSMWFKTAASSGSPGGLQVVEGKNYKSGCDRIVGNGGGSNLQYNDWEEVNFSGSTNVTDGNWHLMTYVLDETHGLLAYVDGVADANTTTPTDNCGVGCSGFNWADQYWIGRGGNCRFNADYFSGLIDDVRFYDHVLSPTAVMQLYNATK